MAELPPAVPVRATGEGLKLSEEQPLQTAVVEPVMAKTVGAPFQPYRSRVLEVSVLPLKASGMGEGNVLPLKFVVAPKEHGEPATIYIATAQNDRIAAAARRDQGGGPLDRSTSKVRAIGRDLAVMLTLKPRVPTGLETLAKCTDGGGDRLGERPNQQRVLSTKEGASFPEIPCS